MELVNRLVAQTGLNLPVTLVFDYPSARALAAHLLDEAIGAQASAPATAPAATTHTDDPIAIVGMSCRFPGGVRSPEDLWRLVADGTDAVGPMPTDRGWPADPDRPYHGGFLADATRFDPAFFGLSPKEAVGMDPQQRLVMEASWEAFEHAGIDPTSLRGSRTGVYVGTAGSLYMPSAQDAANVMTGVLTSIMSGRVAYTLGLEGPAVTVDTGCSASLMTIHLGGQSLRAGECDLVVAGGVMVMATPYAFDQFDALGGWSGDGRCHAFADSAAGMGWGEGVGFVVLERLSDARRNGHDVLAVLRGSAANQDGASNGLTAPSGLAQQRVIRAALSAAQLSAADVDVVEAHGTGTTLGDPIEANALLATYGQQRPPDRPVGLGSVKSNIGHTQGAAGVAGVIKMVMALRHGVLPKTLHVDRPTTAVDWTAGAVEVLTEGREWPAVDRPRRAAVSSFGISGTNVHAIFEQAPPAEAAPVDRQEPAVVPWVVSGRTPAALRDQATRLVSHVDGLHPVDVGWSLVSGRALHEHRAVVVGDLVDGTTALAAGTPAAGVVEGVADVDGRLVFVFPGQGAQWAGMGARLLDESPVFAERMAECAAALEPFVDWSLPEVLRGDLDRVDVVQPVSFAVMVSLASLWESVGVTPDAVVGHSQGEIAAAVVAGALSLEDGARVVALRSQAIARTLAGRGGMISIALPPAEVEPRLPDGLSVAAVNGPAAVVVAGDPAALDTLFDELTAEDVRVRRIPVDYASHSAHVDLLRDELLEVLEPITPREPRLPFYSTVAGEATFDAGYWFRNLRSRVEFEPAIRALLEARHRAFVEVSPHPVLTMSVQETIDDARAVAVGTLRRDDGGLRRFVTSAAELFVRAGRVDWARTFDGTGARRVVLPPYAFQHGHYWSNMATSARAGDPAGLGLLAAGHPMLGAAMELAGSDGVVFTGVLSLATHPWLADHAAGDVVLLPGSGFLELAVRAADQVGADVVEELTLGVPLVLGEHDVVTVQVTVGEPDDAGRRSVTVHSRPAGEPDGPWVAHATGVLANGAPAGGFDVTAWPPEGARPVGVGDLYDRLADAGLAYGPAFRGLRAAWTRDGEVFAEVALPADVEDAGAYGMHPALLDAAFHAASYLDGSGGGLLFSLGGVSLRAGGAASVRVRLARESSGAFSLTAVDAAANPVLRVDSVVSRARDDAAPQAPAAGQQGMYRLDWVDDPAPVKPGPAIPELVAVRVESDVDLPVPARVRDVACRVLRLMQDWLADEGRTGARLVFVTDGAVAVGDRTDVPDVAAAAAWGLVRSAQIEHPDRFVLVDSPEPPETVASVVASGEPQYAVRDGVAHVARLAPLAIDTGDAATPWNPDGTVLITGGTGGLAGHLARHLVTGRGMRHLLLVSRRGEDAPGAAELRAELTDLGASVTIAACDVADRDAVAVLLASIPAEHPLTAVVHTAAALDDGVIEALTPERLATVLDPKAGAAWHLHELTAGTDLAAFVLYSSLSSVMGAPGLGNYAAANAVQDALAQHRAYRGLPATSLVWGRWADDSGMTAVVSDRITHRMNSSGLLPISAERGTAMFDAAVASGQAVAVPVLLDKPALRAGGLVPPLLRGVVRGAARRTAADASAVASDLAQRLRDGDAGDRTRVVVDAIRAQLSAVLGHAPDSVDPRREFRELGLDSLTAVELRNRLSAATGLRLPATMVFDHPTPQVLAEFLVAELLDQPATVAAAGTGRGTARPARPDRDRRHELPLPGRGHLARRPVAAGRRRRRRHRPRTRRPRLARHRPGPRRVRAGRRRVRRRVLRDLAARGAGDGPAAAAAAGDRLGGARARGHRPGSLAGHQGRHVRRRGRARVRGAGRRGRARGHRQLDERRLRPDRLPARPRRARRHPRHRVLVVARGAAPGVPVAAGRRQLARPRGWRDDHGEPAAHPRVRRAGRARRRRPRQGVLRHRRRHEPGRRRRARRGRAAVGRPPQRPRRPRRGAGFGDEPGRRVERADRAERPVAAAGDPCRAGQRRSVHIGRRCGGGARYGYDAG